nr:DUF3857 domain-containing protein [Sunxiuqinia sp.]
MKRHIFTVFLGLFASFSLFGQDNWDASTIADSLKKDADAVIRYFSTDYERSAIDRYQKTVDYVVTVLNENGRSVADLEIYYDRNSEVKSVELSIFDKDGQLVKNIKKKEINDYAYLSSSTLFSDSRIKQYSPSYNYYPYTVRYSYSIDHKAVVSFANWHPTDWFNISVEKARLNFQSPKELGLNYRALNGNFNFEFEETDKTNRYHWHSENVPAVKSEFLSPSYLDLLPTVLLSPIQVTYEGYTGDFGNWENLGKWVYMLMQNKDELPFETLEKIKQLTDTITSEKEKVKTLYEYMQSRTRYVNIALGIGGFQPFPAADVDSKGYGDCKALSNYMHALLKGIGIDSYYTVIGNGSYRKIKFPDFTSLNQTNHIILCVPTENDTIWLECTNQKFPFGYIGSSNSDRYGLLISEAGGTLAKTPTYSPKSNYRNSTINTILQETREADFEVRTTFNNYLYEVVFALLNMSKEEQKRALMKSFSVNGLELKNYSINSCSGDQAKAVLSTEGKLTSYSIKTGDRLFVEPAFLYPNAFHTSIKNDRNHPIYEPNGYVYNDTLNITIPVNYTIEFVPESLDISSVYGSYKLVYGVDKGDRIIIIRTAKINSGTFHSFLFDEINHFLERCNSQEKEKIVLKKKSS